jgi:hypothetical protein
LIALSLLFILSVAAAAPLSPNWQWPRSSGGYNIPDDKRSGVGNSAPDHNLNIGRRYKRSSANIYELDDKRRSSPQHTNTRTPDDR